MLSNQRRVLRLNGNSTGWLRHAISLLPDIPQTGKLFLACCLLGLCLGGPSTYASEDRPAEEQGLPEYGNFAVAGAMEFLTRPSLPENRHAVFCIHTGFESTMSMAQLWRGDLVGGRVRVRFWRVPYERIPRGRETLSNWMWDQWERVDASLQKCRDAPIHASEG